MKQLMAMMLVLVYFIVTTLALGSIRKTSVYKAQYKMALDAGTDAAAKHIAYHTGQQLEQLANGFGKGEEEKLHIEIESEAVLEWFYRLVYANLQIQDNEACQEVIKKYMTMKCLITYDQMAIANKKDEWVTTKPFIVEIGNKSYALTLSDAVKDLSSNEWITLKEIGLTSEQKQAYIANYIMDEIKAFLAKNCESKYYYKVQIALDAQDELLMGITGNNFIVFSEGMPITSLNYFQPKEQFFAFSLGGSELLR